MLTRPEPSPEPSSGDRPRLADGVQLLGKMEGSGFKEPPSMARRADGQVVQLPPLLYAILEQLDGERSIEDVARLVSEQVGRGLQADDLRFVLDEKIRPLGLLAGQDGDAPEGVKADPLLALKLRTSVIPDRLVRGLTTLFRPLFFPPVVVAVLVGWIAFDVWLFGVHGVAQGVRQAIYQPALLLLILGMVVVGAVFHEIGHATGCRYGGAKPGVMGVGIYIVWPAFFTDVTDSYRLGRGGRLRTDLGGVYFNGIFILATAGMYFLTGFEPLLVLIVVQHLEIVRQLLPILRLDGYYVLSDLTGVPDLFGRIKPVLLSLLPWRKADEQVTALKPWARAVISGWVLLIVPILVFQLIVIVAFAPRMIATGWDSFWRQAGTVGDAWGAGEPLAVAAGVVQLLVLALPAAGAIYSIVRISRRIGMGTWRRTEGRPIARAGAGLATVAVIALLAFLWWPNGDYRPIQRNERWTLTTAVQAVGAIPGGSPGVEAVERAEDVPVTSTAGGDRPDTEPTDPAGSPTPDASVSPTAIESPGTPSPSVSPTESPLPTESPTAEPSPSASAG